MWVVHENISQGREYYCFDFPCRSRDFVRKIRFRFSILHWMEMASTLLVTIVLVSLHSTVGHRWSVLDHGADNTFACNNQTCDGRPHSSCLFPEVSVHWSRKEYLSNHSQIVWTPEKLWRFGAGSCSGTEHSRCGNVAQRSQWLKKPRRYVVETTCGQYESGALGHPLGANGRGLDQTVHNWHWSLWIYSWVYPISSNCFVQDQISSNEW